MSGELYLLTPIMSPMVTRAASPDPAAGAPLPPGALGCKADHQGLEPTKLNSTGRRFAVKEAGRDRNNMQDAHVGDSVALIVPAGFSPGTGVSHGSSMTVQQLGASDVHPSHPWTLLSHGVGAVIDKVRSASSSPKALSADIVSTTSSHSSSTRGLAVLLPEPLQQQRMRKAPPCCATCGAAKADGGSCSGCSNMFCKACAAPAASGAGESGLGSPCKNCHSLCNACKPIACSFCDDRDPDVVESSGQASSNITRMCEACAGTCDSCKRVACAACAAGFESCGSCGYASCEGCRLQAHMSGASAAGCSGVIGGCWCAPPLRMANNVRHVSSQRYQMSQLHPSVLACSMEAVGLRDADFDDYDAYDVDCDTCNNQEQLDGVLFDADDWLSPSKATRQINDSHWRAASGGWPGRHAEPSSDSTLLPAHNPRALEAILEDLGCSVSPASSYSGNQAVYGSCSSQGTSFAAAHGGASSWKR